VIPLTVIFTPSARKAAHNNGCSLVPKVLKPMVNRFWWYNLKEKSISINLDVNGRIVEWILKE